MALMDREGGENQAIADISRIVSATHSLYKAHGDPIILRGMATSLQLVKTRMNTGVYPRSFWSAINEVSQNANSVVKEFII